MNINKLQTFTRSELESRRDQTKARIKRWSNTGREDFVSELRVEVKQIAEVLASGEFLREGE
tara:strand:- start:279 stop:464 length:186 start_codon:yes stop_codon:yes gene_type:complete